MDRPSVKVPLRKFTTVVGYLTQDVEVTLDGRPIGVYTPYLVEQEVTVDEIRKAIEPDRTKVVETPAGPKLSKGLGDIPGVSRPSPTQESVRGGIGHSSPAPKPGKK